MYNIHMGGGGVVHAWGRITLIVLQLNVSHFVLQLNLAFLVQRTWTWICINIPNYNNIYMYHLTDPTHARTLGVIYI